MKQLTHTHKQRELYKLLIGKKCKPVLVNELVLVFDA